MTINDVLKLSLKEFNQLTEKELRKVVGVIRDVANKRIKAAEKAGFAEDSPAYKAVQKSGGKITTQGKDLNQLRREYVRGRQFIEGKTSTKKGYEEAVQQFTERVAGKDAETMTKEEKKRFWQAYSRFAERHPSIAEQKNFYKKYQQKIYAMVKSGASARSIGQTLRWAFQKDYEEQQREMAASEQSYTGTSSFTSIQK